MKKIVKVVVIGILIVAVFMGAASILLHVVLPPEKAKALILKQLTGHLHREVSVGTVSVGVLSGVRLTDFKVSESPDFSKGTFLASDEFSLHVALMPLLLRKVEAQLALRHPVVTVIRNADGKTFNFSDLTGSATPAVASSSSVHPSTQKLPPPPFDLLVSRASIDQGVIHFVDRSPAQQSVDVNPLTLKLKNVSLTETFGVQTSLKAKARGIELTFELNGQANLAEGDFTAKTCELSSAGSVIKLTGRASRLKTGHPAADLKVDVDPFDASPWRSFLGLPPELRITGSSLAHARIKGDENQMNISVQVDLTKNDIAYGKTFSKPAKVPLTVTIRGSVAKMQNLQLENLQAGLGALKIAVHGTVDGLTSIEPSVNLHIETNSMPMQEIEPYIAGALPPALKLNGSSRLNADVTGTLGSCRLAAKWQARDLVVTMGDTFSKAAGVPLEASLIGEFLRPPATQGTVSQTLNVQTVAGTLGPIQWSGNGSFKTVGKKSEMLFNVKTNSWSVGELAMLVPMLAVYRPSGHVVVEARASGNPSNPSANGTAVLSSMGAHYEQSEISNVAGTVNFTQQDIGTPRIAGKIDGSEFSLQFAGHRLQTQPDIHLDATFAELDLNKILPPLGANSSAFNDGVSPAEAAGPTPHAALPPMKLSGHLTVAQLHHTYYQGQSLDMKWNLSGVTPDLAHIAGTATLHQGPGHLLNVEKLASQSRAVKIALLPILTLQKLDANGLLKSFGIPSLQTIPFDAIKGDYTFQEGVMNVKEFNLLGKDLAIQTQGTIGLTGMQLLNLPVEMKLAAGALGGSLGQVLQDENGRLTLHFSITGPANSPKIHLDLHEAGKKAVQELLKGFGLGASAPAGTDANGNSTESTAPNPAADLKKALNNLFK